MPEPKLEDPSVLDVVEVLSGLETDAQRGLTGTEASDRLISFGPNEVRQSLPVPVWRKVLQQFQDPLIYLLFAAIVISLAAWWLEGTAEWPYDAIVIAVIIVLNAVLGYLQESGAERAVAALRRMGAPMTTVLRDGSTAQIPARELVPGDVLVLGEGDSVAADARLLSASALQVSEASLTGESAPVIKDSAPLQRPASLGDRQNMIFSGTAVTQGVGRAVVTATGMATQTGQIADLLETTHQDPTPLQREITRVGRMLGGAVILIAVAVIGTVFLVFKVHSVEGAVTALLLGVALAVAAVPEGLPAILSVVLALGVRRMAGRNAIVKDLSSVETLGSASVICTDKTGTLTRGEMSIGRVVTAAGEVVVSGTGYRPEGQVECDGSPIEAGSGVWKQTALVLSGGSLANDSALFETDGEWLIHGDPTEAAFLVAEAKMGLREHRAGRFDRVGEVPFTSERKMMSSIEADCERDGKLTLVTKGAPDVLVQRCSRVQVGDLTEPLDAAWRSKLLGDVERLSSQAFRTIAVAYRPLGDDAADAFRAGDGDGDGLEQDLIYAGVVGIIDPPRQEAATAIEEAHRAGIRVVMITGDHPSTAARIATDLGITDPGTVAVSGTELESLDDAQLRRIVPTTTVYARVSPRSKLRIVTALKAQGQVVAMTGDGVNDAPALKAADIGVAMGLAGTEVAKEAANMILTDDNFATIVRSVREGRIIFGNIRKFLRYLLSSNTGEVLTVFLGVVFAGVIGLSDDLGTTALPLLATQILWINLLTDSGTALAMGVDPETEDVMDRPPRRLNDRLIDGRMWAGVVMIGLVIAIATLTAIDFYLPGGLIPGTQTLDNARTAGFTVLVLAQLFNALNARSETRSAFHKPFANRWLWAAIGIAVALQVAVVQTPVLQTAFTTTPLTLSQWGVCIALASAVLWVSEARKLTLRQHAK
ncbi:MAG: cation-translocating P-type ATPase [Actinomycetota bacterium]|nr:cation-translocating P-type ATPase [Actinomycetota bacterium]